MHASLYFFSQDKYIIHYFLDVYSLYVQYSVNYFPEFHMQFSNIDSAS
jgi:hypothetical protein